MDTQLYEKLNALADDYTPVLYKKLADSIQKKKAVNSRELLDSLSVVAKKSSNDAPTIVISFAGHGRFIEMKNLFFGKTPPIDPIKEWVESKGISKFKYIPGYEGKNFTPTRDKAASRIAWGIVMAKRYGSRSGSYGANKGRKLWKQKTLGISIAHLGHLVEEALAETASKMILQPLINR